MTPEEAKFHCKIAGIKQGINGSGYVFHFASHPITITNKKTGEEVTLNTGYGVRSQSGYIKYDHDKDGRPKPWNSYWEALANTPIGDEEIETLSERR